MTIKKRTEKEDYILALILMVIAGEHIASYFALGRDFFDKYPLQDSIGYLNAGIRFAETGIISIYSDYPTAMIMPGMPVLIGMLTKIFGSGEFLKYTGFRIVWYFMGISTVFFTAKAVTALSTKRAGNIAASVFILPNHILSDNFLLTETPFMLFISMMLYYLFTMKESRGAFIGFLAAFLCAFMFRAEALIILAFSVIYMTWAIGKKECLKRLFCIVICILAFIVPWTIRNYKCFHAFIPITYGGGNPKLLGTQQGEGFPSTEDPEILENTDRTLHEKYSQYYDENGDVTDKRCEQFLSLTRDGIMADLILKKWAETDRKSLLKSYLIHKPRLMLNWVWYWEELFGMPYNVLHYLSIANMLFCFYSVILSGILRKKHYTILFLLGSYLGNVYVHALSFATDRYSYVMMLNRIIAAAIGADLTIRLIENIIQIKRQRKNTIAKVNNIC